MGSGTGVLTTILQAFHRKCLLSVISIFFSNSIRQQKCLVAACACPNQCHHQKIVGQKIAYKWQTVLEDAFDVWAATASILQGQKNHTMPEAQVPLQSSHSQTRSPLSFLLWVIGMSAFCRPFGSPGNGFVMKIHHRYQILALFTFSVARNGKQPLFARTKTEIAQKTMGSCPSCFLEFGFLLSSSLC